MPPRYQVAICSAETLEETLNAHAAWELHSLHYVVSDNSFVAVFETAAPAEQPRRRPEQIPFGLHISED
jgi:pentose-5-phosphate-3-epimerase